jgi:hypothetical protein
MAKALKTRQKLMFRTDGQRPRNPPAVAARRRAAAPHLTGQGSQRQLARRRLRRLLGQS